MGRDLTTLHTAHLCALRRWMFYGQALPGWLVRLIATPTHIMFINGVYVRVLWVSQHQMEELYIYSFQCYKEATNPRHGKNLPNITETIQCHYLGNIARGSTKFFYKQGTSQQDGSIV